MTEEAALVRFKPAIVRALTEINARSGGRYPPERIFELFREQLRNPQLFALWLGLDVEKLAHTAPVDAVVALLTLNLIPDEVGTPVAYLSRAWIAPGWRGKPFDVGLPLVERWARARGAVALLTTSERDTAAFARWAGRRGFARRETVYEKVLSRKTED